MAGTCLTYMLWQNALKSSMQISGVSAGDLEQICARLSWREAGRGGLLFMTFLPASQAPTPNWLC